MVRIEKDGKIEQLDLAMPKSYWMRTRKPTVDYLRDTPFATDRQLEDQRIQQMVNRNPQLYNPTKVDKVRSQVIVAPKGESRSVAMKANALNKFVREASGVHNYTIVAPPKQVINDSHSKEILDPETNPRVRSYAVEAKQKPVLCSFGHRPSSASRTFHPATMKLKLRHGAIVPALDPHRTTVGLPVAVLKKVISAPPIVNVLEEARMASQPPSPSDTPINSKPGSPINGQRSSYNDLFLSKEEQDSLFSGTSGRQRLTPIQKGGGGSQATWVSGQTEEKQKSTKKPSLLDDRPTWDEGFHRIHRPSNHVFQLKASGLLVKSKQPLSELLHRFESLSVAENQFHPFCTEKQATDKIERSGVALEIPKSKAVKGQKLYYDPLDNHVEVLKAEYKQNEAKKIYKRKVNDYKRALKTIPKVDYYPTTVLATMRKKGGGESSFGSIGGYKNRMPVKAESEYVLTYGTKGDGYGEDGEDVQIAQEENNDGRVYKRMPEKALPDYVQMYGSNCDEYGGEDGEYVPIAEDQESDETMFSLAPPAIDLDAQYPDWRRTEYEIKSTLKKAQKGDMHVLYDTIIKQKDGGSNNSTHSNGMLTKQVS